MKVPIFGLVLAGGKSSRMGQDKSQLVYAGKPQFQAAYELLERVCEKVFVSSRKDQFEASVFGRYPQVVDLESYAGHGPLSGILSAMKAHPQAAWFVLACDLPFVTPETLKYLIDNRRPDAVASAYRSSSDGLPEPLCAIWEPGNRERIEQLFFIEGIHCPRKALIRFKAFLCDPKSPDELDNINHPEEADKAKIRLKRTDH